MIWIVYKCSFNDILRPSPRVESWSVTDEDRAAFKLSLLLSSVTAVFINASM